MSKDCGTGTMYAANDVNINVTSRMAKAVLPLDTPSIHSPMVTRDLEAIKPWYDSLYSYISPDGCIVDARMHEIGAGDGIRTHEGIAPGA